LIKAQFSGIGCNAVNLTFFVQRGDVVFQQQWYSVQWPTAAFNFTFIVKIGSL